MADNELLIKINADAKNLEKAFDDARAKTENLDSRLTEVAAVSAVAFAALTAEVFLSVAAFSEAEKASKQLTLALQNQGIFTEKTKQEYQEYADAVQKATGIDNDAVTAAQAVTQGFLGQTKVTKELSFAVADLAEGLGTDLNTAATLIGKTIGTSTNALARYGVELDANATEQEKMAAVLTFVNGKFKDQAAAANQGLGGIRGLQTAFGNLQEEIGARFAPVISAAIKGITKILEVIQENKALLDFAAAFIAGGIAVTGLITALALGAKAFLVINAATAAFGITLNASLAGIPILIGLLIGGIVLLAKNWETVTARITALTEGLTTFLSGAFGAIGKILSGVFNFDIGKIKEGLAEVKDAFQKGSAEAFKTIPDEQKKADEKQDAQKAKAAAQREAKEREHQKTLRDIAKAENDLVLLNLQNASKAQIELKQKEIETLKQLEKTKNAEQIELLQQRLEQIQALEEEAQAQQLERDAAFVEEKRAADEENAAIDFENRTAISQQKLTDLEASLLTEKDVEAKIQAETLAARIAARNAEAEDRKRYGAIYAAIQATINSNEVQGTKKAAGELVALQQSKNQTLRTIGKAAAITDITIKTAQSAINIYQGFSTIPIIGPILGIAGAAAAIAFGAEQIGNVVGAAQGGVVPSLIGSSPNRDSVRALLTPGELIVPKNNFEEVVGAVRAQRADVAEQSLDINNSPVQVSIGFDGREASQVLTARQNEDFALGVSKDRTANTT